MILLARKVYGLFSAARSAHGTGPRARRLQDIESDTGYDTRRRAPDGTLAIVWRCCAVRKLTRNAPYPQTR